MARNRFANRTCVYCGRPSVSGTADHVIARQFFPVDSRGYLPKVPACRDCNNTKSRLELYVLSVLPLGGFRKALAPRSRPGWGRVWPETTRCDVRFSPADVIAPS